MAPAENWKGEVTVALVPGEQIMAPAVDGMQFCVALMVKLSLAVENFATITTVVRASKL